MTAFPFRPFVSSRSFAVTLGGTGSSRREEQRQSAFGQPQVGQTEPLSVE